MHTTNSTYATLTRLVTLSIVSLMFALSSACKLNETQKKQPDSNGAKVSAAKSPEDNNRRPKRAKDVDDQDRHSSDQNTATQTNTATATTTSTATATTTAQSTQPDVSALTPALSEIIMAYVSGDRQKFYALLKQFILNGGLQALKEQSQSGSLNQLANPRVLSEIIDEAESEQHKQNLRAHTPEADASDEP